MVVVHFNAGAYGKNVGIKYDVEGVEIEFLSQQIIATLADILTALQCIGLTVFVESHDDDPSPVMLTKRRLL